MKILSNLVQLTDNDKRLLIAIFLVVILLFLIAGYIFELVKRIVTNQGRKIDAVMANMVNTAVLRSPKEFRREARRKNRMLLFKGYIIPFLLVLVGLIIHLLASTFYGHIIDIFDYENEGFITILYVWDWPSMPRSSFFGLSLPSDWPPVINQPHFEASAIVSYFIGPIYLVGLVWLFLSTQAYVARIYRIFQLNRLLFSNDLTNKRLADVSTQKAGVEQPAVGVALNNEQTNK
ncbi:MAG: hypothetical protein PHP09_00675 [Bacilli bacterium]|nr:hypothetical protein [Bacilli bacterium]MDD4344438.1 hypothetical protein [Bacilli bacterium]MDY0399367.1 hypothetical protein [Bacilli bacterium]